MSAHTILTCDSEKRGRKCRSRSPVYHTCIVSFAREMAQYAGWATQAATRSDGLVDLCPRCAVRQAAPPSTGGRVCRPSAPCHLLGHDRVGHRITKLLALQGMSLDEAAAFAPADLSRLPGFGPACVARIADYRTSKRARS